MQINSQNTSVFFKILSSKRTKLDHTLVVKKFMYLKLCINTEGRSVFEDF